MQNPELKELMEGFVPEFGNPAHIALAGRLKGLHAMYGRVKAKEDHAKKAKGKSALQERIEREEATILRLLKGPVV